MLLTGCIIIGGKDDAGTSDGANAESSSSATVGGSSETGGTCSGGTGPSSSDTCGSDTCGYDPCDGSGGCWGTYAPTTGWPTTGDDGSEPLITTGNEDATEWSVTVRHTFTGQSPEDGTYLTTTVVDMGSDFQAVVEIPHEGGGTSYGWFHGDYADGVVTMVGGGVESFDVSVEGTLELTELTLDGSGTFHDADTNDLMGTWEILAATPLP